MLSRSEDIPLKPTCPPTPLSDSSRGRRPAPDAAFPVSPDPPDGQERTDGLVPPDSPASPDSPDALPPSARPSPRRPADPAPLDPPDRTDLPDLLATLVAPDPTDDLETPEDRDSLVAEDPPDPEEMLVATVCPESPVPPLLPPPTSPETPDVPETPEARDPLETPAPMADQETTATPDPRELPETPELLETPEPMASLVSPATPDPPERGESAPSIAPSTVVSSSRTEPAAKRSATPYPGLETSGFWVDISTWILDVSRLHLGPGVPLLPFLSLLCISTSVSHTSKPSFR